MVTLLLDSAQLEVVLSPVERAMSFRRRSVRIDRSRIEKVQLTDDAWTWLRGVPSPGTHVRGVVAMGTWRSSGGADFVIVRRRRPAVVIDLVRDEDDAAGGEFHRLVLSTRHGLALVQALQVETDAEPTDVTDIVAEAPDGAATKKAPAQTGGPRRGRVPKVAPAT